MNTAPSLLMSLDPDGRIVNYNTACERASGFENVEDVRHEYFWDVFIAPDEREDGPRPLRARIPPIRRPPGRTRSSTGAARRW